MNACVRVNFLDQQGNTGGGDGTDNTSTDKVGSTGVSGGGSTVGTVGGVGSVSSGHGGSGGQSEDNGLELHFWLVREVWIRSGGTPFYIFSRRCLHGVIIALRFSFSFHQMAHVQAAHLDPSSTVFPEQQWLRRDSWTRGGACFRPSLPLSGHFGAKNRQPSRARAKTRSW